MMYLNKNEEKIIGRFMEIEDEHIGNTLILKWRKGGKVTAKYNSFIEDESDYDMDDENYEEFWSFVFENEAVDGEVPITVTEDNYFTVNYHNFPDEIISDGVKIN